MNHGISYLSCILIEMTKRIYQLTIESFQSFFLMSKNLWDPSCNYMWLTVLVHNLKCNNLGFLGSELDLDMDKVDK